MNLKRVALLVAALAMISAAGCGKLAEKATEKATEKVVEQACKDGEDCEVDFSKDGETMKIGDNEMAVGKNVDYPDGYPDYLKLDGFAPMYSSKMGSMLMTVTLTNPDADGANWVAALTGQADDAGCTPKEDMPDILEGEMIQVWRNCPDGSLQISQTKTQESERVLQVSLRNTE